MYIYIYYIYTYAYIHIMDYYLDIKKIEILPFVTPWMDHKGNVVTEISHKEKQILYDFYFLWTLKKQKPKLIDTGTRLVVARDTRLEVRQKG